VDYDGHRGKASVTFRSAGLIVLAGDLVGLLTRVRAIFALYLRYQGLLPVVQELARRGWVTKAWRTRRGKARGIWVNQFPPMVLYET
jgi:hypothetical protein